MDFHIKALKVMLVIFLLSVVINGAELMRINYVKSLKNEVYSRVLGDNYLDCMESVQFNPDLPIDAKAIAAQRTINIYVALFIILKIGILYLFSCFIVRYLTQPKSNKLSELTP